MTSFRRKYDKIMRESAHRCNGKDHMKEGQDKECSEGFHSVNDMKEDASNVHEIYGT